MGYPRSTDPLRQALTALGTVLHETINEMEALDSGLLAAARDAEATLQRQAEEHLLALEEAERKSRAQVTEEMEARFEAMVKEAVDVARAQFKFEQEGLVREWEQRLAAAKGNWESERARLEADGESANQLALERNEEFRRAQSAVEEMSREIQRLRQAREDWDAERGHLLAERDAANQAARETKDEFFRMLSDTEEAAAIALDRQIATAVDRVRAEGSTEALLARQELERKWQEEVEQLTRELERTNQQLNEIREEHAGALAEQEKSSALVLARDTAAAVERMRTEMRAEAVALREQLEIEHSRVLAETKKNLTYTFEKDKSAAVDRVRAELTRERDGLLVELARRTEAATKSDSEQKRLVAHVEDLSRQLAESNAQQQRLSINNSKNAGTAPTPAVVTADVLLAEVARVERALDEVSELIQAPTTALSVMIRKNVERTELESYLKGLRFLVSGK